MNTAYLNALATAGASAITHIALVNGSGVAVSARMPVSWTAPSGGVIRPTANIVFAMEAGDAVAGWRGYSAASGGTDYEGAPLTPVTFGNDGTYTLQAASTGISHTAA